MAGSAKLSCCRRGTSGIWLESTRCEHKSVGVVGKEGKRAKKSRQMIIKLDKVNVRVASVI